MNIKTKLILASASAARHKILQQIHIPFIAVPADVPEEKIKEYCIHEEKTSSQTALKIACEKALKISHQYQENLIIGADQILLFKNQIFDKPKTMEQARKQLKMMRGKSHNLITAACVVQQEKNLWSTANIATIHMRNFSDKFLDSYLHSNGEKLLHSCGACLIEEEGALLLSSMEGDWFSILGLPLLPLLTFLRTQNITPT